MTRISLDLDETLNKALKQYCLNHFREPYGKQQEVLREALVEFLDRRKKTEASPIHEKKPEKKIIPVSREGEKRRPRIADDPALVAKIDAMIRDGKNIADIANEIGYAWSTVKSYLTKRKD
jgi:DNA-binding NarL/FixJ family response regulator